MEALLGLFLFLFSNIFSIEFFEPKVDNEFLTGFFDFHDAGVEVDFKFDELRQSLQSVKCIVKIEYSVMAEFDVTKLSASP